MAPRGRTRKVGLQRMDAAIDAMKVMGFAPHIVRKTVKRLLKVYDGNEGWVFIEEGSYKLLIETIIEEQEAVQCRETDQSMEGQRLQNETTDEDCRDLSIAGHSCSVSIPSCSAAACFLEGDEQEMNHASKRKIRKEVEEGFCGGMVLDESRVAKGSNTSATGNGVGEASKDVTRAITDTNRTLSLPLHQPLAASDPNATLSLPWHQDNPSIVGVQRRRPPCYGWFEGNQEEVDETCIVYLPPVVPISTEENGNS